MLSRRRLSPRLALAVSAVALGASAHAVVATTGLSTPIDTAYSFVGYVDNLGGSGVAVGPHTFLTAGHVVQGGITSPTFTLGGVTYSIASSLAAPDVLVTDPSSPQFGQSTHVDLTLVTINGTFSGYYNIATALNPAAPVTMVGYGNSGGVAADGLGYAIAERYGDGNRHAGVNTVDGAFDSYVSPSRVGPDGQGGGPLIYSLLGQAGEAAIGVGDSGGGWFQGSTLVGISDTTVRATSSAGLRDYGFASNNNGSAYFGSAAINLTDPRLRAFLANANPVPEPAPLAALGIGALALLRRRRR